MDDTEIIQEKEIEKLRTQFRAELENTLDEYFPKIEDEGEAKRLNKRGEALMLFTAASTLFTKILTAALAQATRDTIARALEVVEKYQNPYPEDVFIPPSAEWRKEVHEFCVSKGHTLDALSADMGRRAVKNTKEDLIAALRSLEKPNE